MSHTGERSTYPTAAQIDILLDQLEKNPDLAKGFLKNQNARQRAQVFWQQIQLQLNSVGGGAVKTWKQWMKYWTDKKSATKKKAAQRAANRRRTGGGAGVDVELTTAEERIVALLGGESFATGDSHLTIPLLHNVQFNNNTTLDNIELLPENISHNTTEELSTPELVNRTELNTSPTIFEVNNILPHTSEPPPGTSEPLPGTSQPAPIRQRHSPPHTPTRSPRHFRTSVLSTPRRRRIRGPASPPSQRQSQFVRTTDRFLRLEERRIDIEASNASLLRAVLEHTAQKEHALLDALNNVGNQLIAQQSSQNIAMAEALKTLGEGLKALSEAINPST